MHRIGLWAPEGIDSFAGVDFGDSYHDVQVRYPSGEPQTSPFGAQAYRLAHVEYDGVPFQSVIYEFVHGSGMQLVMARFAGRHSAVLYRSLRKQLGPPEMASASSNPADKSSGWRLDDGTMISFDGHDGWLVILGPKGDVLRQDIKLTQEDAAFAD